ncbi:MAG: Gfo/Idh/MocA family oxidoreductase [Firmicutes bacterium]|nr:Gfo/Idh/MocA family oxidoreductase [Bacillota bacterium]
MKRIGVVGLGNMGTMYTRVAAENPRVRLAAVCDVDDSKRDPVSTSWSCRAYPDFSEMFARERLDGVVVCLPDHLHRDVVLSATEAGVHILLEKPLATRMEDAIQMVRAIRSASVKCQMAYIFRWTPPYVAAREAVQSGEIGEVLSISARINDRIDVPLRMLPWASSSSPAWFLMSHEADAARWIAQSEVGAVTAVGARRKLLSLGIDTYDYARAELVFRSGATASLQACWIAPNSQPALADARMEVLGTGGILTVDTGYQMGAKMASSLQNFRCIQSEICGRLRGIYPTMFDSFVDVLEGTSQPACDETDGLENVRILTAIEMSLKRGSSVSLEEVPVP